MKEHFVVSVSKKPSACQSQSETQRLLMYAAVTLQGTEDIQGQTEGPPAPGLGLAN